MPKPLTPGQWLRLSPSERARLLAGAGRPDPRPQAARPAGRAVSAPGAAILNAADPASLRPVNRRPVFDPAPHRNRGMPACPTLTPALLNQVIATAVAFGMPQAEAEEARSNPYVRTHVALLAMLVWDAQRGDQAARAALDRIKFAFNHAGEVAETFAAREQPADGAELQALMGLD